MSVNELTRASEWIYSKLVAASAVTAIVGSGSAARIYADVAPPGASWPFVIFQHQGSVDVTGQNPGTRVLVSSLWTVKAVARGESYAALATLADALDAALQAASGTADDATIYSCVREQPLQFAELDESSTPGGQWRHLGAIWRILVQVP